MKKQVLIGVSIASGLVILIAAVAFSFAGANAQLNAFSSVDTDVNSSAPYAEPQEDVSLRVQAVQQAQSNVSFRILEPAYIPPGYRFESAGGSKFKGATSDIDMASFSYKNGDEQLTVKEIIMVKIMNGTEQSEKPKDTREIVNINGIEGRFSEENGIKFLGWKIGNLSLSINSWKNEGGNQTTSSLGKEEMIRIAESIREKSAESAISEAQAKVSFMILKPAYIPEGYRMNTAQTSGTRFRGAALEAEQAMLSYTKGNEFYRENEYLNLKEFFVIKDETSTDDPDNTSGIPGKPVDINGVQGRFLEESNGMKSLNWKIGALSLTIISYAYGEDNFAGTSLSMDEMIKMARSVK